MLYDSFMIIISLNVGGSDDPNKKNGIKNFCQLKNIDVVCFKNLS